jgi:hypothetical protein
MGLSRERRTIWRGVCLALAVFALAFKIAAPPGFMIDSRAGAFPVVICTGHGPLSIPQHGDKGSPAQKSADGVCPFAAAPAPTPAPVVASLAEPIAAIFEAASTGRSAEQTPGRGLAAAPPPSHAPPAHPELT